ncbi:MAG: transcription elongation factor GreA [Chloroflexi bacterium]|nr:transcription elongation factor GreA [Chloroflexota bacterium]
MSKQSGARLPDVLTDYLALVKGTGGQAAQGELNRFIRWCGRDRGAGDLTPLEIEEFCATLEGIGDDRSHRLAIVKMFLSHLHRAGLTTTNLARHAKIRRSTKTARFQSTKGIAATAVQLTQEHFQEMETQLVALKEARLQTAKEIRRAAADKDVSDNAPLDAARERQGHIEARIREMESTLRRATILEKGKKNTRKGSKIALGSRVVLRHKETRKSITYLLVETNEADPANGKLSVASPVGKAVVGHAKGDTVEVATPGGTASYVVARIE